jgi:peptidoglycan/xylan/chitin deacetylase (PgdA/CDA1 family)
MCPVDHKSALALVERVHGLHRLQHSPQSVLLRPVAGVRCVAGESMTVALIYHDVVAADEADAIGFPGLTAARYKLEPDRFDTHLDAIEAAGLEVGLVASGEHPPLALTFDDGGASAPRIAEALEARGWRGHFFVTTGMIGRSGFLSAEGVRELARRGHVVGSHSHSHPNYMARLPSEEIAREWWLSRDVLGEALGEEVIHASVPGGYVSSAVFDAAAAAGYRVLMTSEPVARAHTVDGMTVFGRYAIWATTRPTTAAAYAAGKGAARARLAAGWKVKRFAKTVSPGAYEALRRVRARLARP